MKLVLMSSDSLRKADKYDAVNRTAELLREVGCTDNGNHLKGQQVSIGCLSCSCVGYTMNKGMYSGTL